MSDPNAAQAQRELETLLTTTRSLMLATLGADGNPEASYAPFVRDAEGCLYVFVSRLSRHTANLAARRPLSVLLIEDEAACRQIFARKRLSYRCVAEPVAPDSADHGPRLAQFAARFGEVVEVLRGLPDFVLFRLRPQEGTFVLGFGQAYRLGGPALDRLEHIRPEPR